MIYLVVGRTGSGKDYLTNCLVDKGFPVVKSYTTRPRRTENEDSHIFITPEEAKQFKDKVATTVINGYEYFATAEQVNNSKVYIIDPRGIEELTANMPETDFCIIHVTCSDDERKYRAVQRVAAENRKKEEAVFNARDASEKEMFDAFDDETTAYRNGMTSLKDNVLLIMDYDNTFSEEYTKEFVDFVLAYDNTHNRLVSIIKDALSLPEFSHNKDNLRENMVKGKDTNGNDCYITPGYMAQDFIRDPKKFIDFIVTYTSVSPRFDNLV